MITCKESTLRQFMTNEPDEYRDIALCNWVDRAIAAMQILEYSTEFNLEIPKIDQMTGSRESQTRDIENLVNDLSRRTENLRLHDSIEGQTDQSMQASSLESGRLTSDFQTEAGGALEQGGLPDNPRERGQPSLLWETDPCIGNVIPGVTGSENPNGNLAPVSSDKIGRIIATILEGVYDSPGLEEAPFATRRKMVLRALVPVWAGIMDADKSEFLHLCNISYLHLETVKRGEMRPPCLQVDELNSKVQTPGLETPKKVVPRLNTTRIASSVKPPVNAKKATGMTSPGAPPVNAIYQSTGVTSQVHGNRMEWTAFSPIYQTERDVTHREISPDLRRLQCRNIDEFHTGFQIKTNLIQTTPVETDLLQTTPVETNLIQTTPVEANLIQTTPVEANLIQTTP
ncbi:MAG: hypothetical protein GY702_22750, partial [Desulfobulbaceae bacterium]|nr:hypothetical protein [Desulfobulbaceae bacterium]